MADDTQKCRALVSPSCYHGKRSTYANPDGWREDGTYDPSTDTIVCDPCYIAIGQPPRGGALEQAIRKAQEGRV